MKTKKILSIALAILMILGTFAVGASAAETEIKNTDIIIADNIISGLEESYWLTVDGALTSDGASASNYNIAIIPATDISEMKIVLNNAQISENSPVGDDAYVGIYTTKFLDLELKGSNKIDVFPESEATVYGIHSYGGLKVFGNGSLELNAGNEWTVSNGCILGYTVEISDDVKLELNIEGIYQIKSIVFADLTVSDNAEIEINEIFTENPDAEYYVNEDYLEGYVYAYGLYSEDGDIKLSDNAKISINMTGSAKNSHNGVDIDGSLELSEKAQLTINGNDSAGARGILIKNGDLTVKDDASINIKMGNVDTGLSNGIYLSRKKETGITVSDNAKIIAVAGDALWESFGIAADGILQVSDNAYVSAESGDIERGVSAGACFPDGITLSGKAKLVAKSGDSSDESYGVYSKNNITVSDDAVIEGYAGIGTRTAGIYSRNLIANGNAKITGESKGSTEYASIGVYAVLYFEAYDNAVINAKGGEGKDSCGLLSGEIKIHGSAKIDAVASNAEGMSIGIFVEDETFSVCDNATVTAKSGKGIQSGGISALESDGIVVSGNAVVVAKASEGTEYSVGIIAVNLDVKNNASLKSTASKSEFYSFGIYGFNMTISDSASVEAAGDNSAFFTDSQEINYYDGAYIAVSTDTNPENAVVYNGTDLLAAYANDKGDIEQESPFKYVLIAPEEPEVPEEPEPELNFFEQLIVDIVEFFDSIKAFFESLFSFLG